MLTLNLLSHTKKEELRFRKIFSLIKDLFLLLLVFTLFTAIILSFADIILVNAFNTTVFDTSLVNINTKLFNEDLKKISKTVSDLKGIQAKTIFYDDLMIKVTKIIPQNINLDQLTINTETNKALFKGNAPLRDDLILFQKNLENSGMFVNIESPLSNLLEKNNIFFVINANLKLDKESPKP